MASSEEKVHGPAHRPPPTELESPTGESPDNGVLVGAGKIAGIGGIALVVLLFVYRELIRSTLFPTMKESSAAILIGAVVLFTFLISIIAIFSWHTKAATGGTQSKPGTWPFLVLVAGILFFVFWFAREFRPQNATDVKTDTASLPGPEPHLPPSPLRVGQELLLQGKFDEAQLVFESVQTDPSLAAAAWYWRSRVALARGAPAVAVEYVEEALRLDSSASYVAGLKIKAQLLRGGRHRTYARDYADEFAGHETPLGVWVNCVAAAGIFDALVTTAKEMDSKCPLPPFPWHLYEEGHPGAQE